MTKWNLDDIKAKARERRAEALRMQRGGMSIRQICDAWNISRTRVEAILSEAKRDEARAAGG